MNDTYKERCNFQLDEWVKGNPIHNDIDNECCPDFSCCQPDFLQPEEIRKTFAVVSKRADEEEFNPEHHPHEDAKIGMLMTFLGDAIAKAGTDKKVHIVSEVSHKISQN